MCNTNKSFAGKDKVMFEMDHYAYPHGEPSLIPATEPGSPAFIRCRLRIKSAMRGIVKSPIWASD